MQFEVHETTGNRACGMNLAAAVTKLHVRVTEFAAGNASICIFMNSTKVPLGKCCSVHVVDCRQRILYHLYSATNQKNALLGVRIIHSLVQLQPLHQPISVECELNMHKVLKCVTPVKTLKRPPPFTLLVIAQEGGS